MPDEIPPSQLPDDEDDSDNDEENWPDVPVPEGEEAEPTKDLFSTTTLNSPAACIAHMKEKHSFDLPAVCQKRGLDFYGCIKFINYIRQQELTAEDAQTAVIPNDDESLLQPVIPGDPLLTVELVEDSDEEECENFIPQVHEKARQIQKDLAELESTLNGDLLRRGTPEYEQTCKRVACLNDTRDPLFVVLVANVQDVVTSVRYCSERGLGVAVASGCQSAFGMGHRDGLVVLDVSRLGGVSIDAAEQTATCEAGATVGTLVADAAAHNLNFVGPMSKAVGVIGYALGGGWSPLSRLHGWAVDNILSMQVVLASGEITNASPNAEEQTERDLFWALAGAGGYFGVVISMKVKLIPNPSHDVHLTTMDWKLCGASSATGTDGRGEVGAIEFFSDILAATSSWPTDLPQELFAVFALQRKADATGQSPVPTLSIQIWKIGGTDENDVQNVPAIKNLIDAYNPTISTAAKSYTDMLLPKFPSSWTAKCSTFVGELNKQFAERIVEMFSTAPENVTVRFLLGGNGSQDSSPSVDHSCVAVRGFHWWLLSDARCEDGPGALEAQSWMGLVLLNGVEKFVVGHYVHDVAPPTRGAQQPVSPEGYWRGNAKRLQQLKALFDPTDMFPGPGQVEWVV